MRASKGSAGFPIKWGIPALVSFAFAFIWLAIYTTALANGVNTGGLGNAALGEMILLLAGLPVVLLGISRDFSLLGIGLGVAAFLGLFVDSVIFQSPLVSSSILSGLTTLSAAGAQFTYQSSRQSIVITLMAFSTSEESGMGLLRTLFDFAFNVLPGTPNYLLKGLMVSAITTAPMFDMIHLFVTVPAYSQLVNAPPVFGVFNLALLLTPFSFSAYFARIILDTSIRASKDYIAGIVGHAGFDGFVTGHVLGLF